MKKILTVEQVVNFYPYNVKIMVFGNSIVPYRGFLTPAYLGDLSWVRLILRPLSDLIVKINFYGELLIPLIKLLKIEFIDFEIQNLIEL